MTIKYKIQLLSDWHCGSGLDSGSDADALVIKDEKWLPYIPGKTIKGLLKESMTDMMELGNIEITTVDDVFGKINEDESTTAGKTYFSNAQMQNQEEKEITSNKLQTHLYRNMASTAIGEEGIAKDGSLRVIEVCIPLNLYGEIEIVETYKEAIENAMKWTRHLGSHRNRGLGRCKWTIIENQ